MSETCETVKIESGDSYAIINKCDFDEAEHVLYADANANGKVTAKEIKAKLDALGIEYDSKAKKAELEELLAGAE